MSESLSRGESNATAETGAVGEPSAWASDLFGQYGPCPKCGAETVTYSREFEESDLACYTCGHWLGVHETTAAPSHRADTGDSTAAESSGSTGAHDSRSVLWKRLRSLF